MAVEVNSPPEEPPPDRPVLLCVDVDDDMDVDVVLPLPLELRVNEEDVEKEEAPSPEEWVVEEVLVVLLDDPPSLSLPLVLCEVLLVPLLLPLPP